MSLQKFFDGVFIAGLLSFLAFVVVTIIIGILFPDSPSVRMQAVGTIAVLMIVTTILVCVFLLWLEGWYLTVAYWNERPLSTNLFYIVFLLIGTVFAAFGIHYLEQRRTGRG